MERKEFISLCGLACIGSTFLSGILQSCSGFRTYNGNITDGYLVVPLSEFEMQTGNGKQEDSNLIVYNNDLKFPVCITRFSDKEYSAVWMECTHQGSELQVFGDTFQCPSHGSEFTNRGIVKTGPANKPLRTFAVNIEKDMLKISLK